MTRRSSAPSHHEKRRDIAVAYARGDSLKCICERFGCSLSTVYRAVRGMPRRCMHTPTPRMAARIRRFTAIGLGYRHIAKLVGLSPNKARALVREARARFPSEIDRLRDENARLRAELETARARTA